MPPLFLRRVSAQERIGDFLHCSQDLISLNLWLFWDPPETKPSLFTQTSSMEHLQTWHSPAKRFFSYLACSSRDSSWNARGGPSGKREGNFSDSSCCWIRWYSLRLAGTAKVSEEKTAINISACCWRSHAMVPSAESRAERKHSLNSPLHCQVILRWQLAPGLLKSQAAHVASSTIAEGWSWEKGRMNGEEKRPKKEVKSGKAGDWTPEGATEFLFA